LLYTKTFKVKVCNESISNHQAQREKETLHKKLDCLNANLSAKNQLCAWSNQVHEELKVSVIQYYLLGSSVGHGTLRGLNEHGENRLLQGEAQIRGSVFTFGNLEQKNFHVCDTNCPQTGE